MERERRSLQSSDGSVRCDVSNYGIAITDFGSNWGERAWDRISGQRGTVLASKSAFSFLGRPACPGDPLEAQIGIVGKGGGKRPNIPEGLRQEIRGG